MTKFVFNQPVRKVVLDKDLISASAPLDETQNNLIMLHVCLIDFPLSVIATTQEKELKSKESPLFMLVNLKLVCDKVQTMLRDFKLAALVVKAKNTEVAWTHGGIIKQISYQDGMCGPVAKADGLATQTLQLESQFLVSAVES